jgi:hypothetical protein
MPYEIDRPIKRLIALASACLPLLVFAAPAAADGYQQYGGGYQQYIPSAPTGNSCSASGSTAQAFSAFGDLSNYTLLPDGAFQNSAADWTLNGASVVPGGEPWNVSGSANPQSLSLPAGSYAVSPTFCVSDAYPSWRFFAESGNSSGGLQVTALYSDIWGHSGQINAVNLSSNNYPTWEPTPVLPLGSVVPPGDVVSVRLVFSVAGGQGGNWNVDDLFVDPYSR